MERALTDLPDGRGRDPHQRHHHGHPGRLLKLPHPPTIRNRRSPTAAALTAASATAALTLALTLALALTLSGCDGGGSGTVTGDAAIWSLAPGQSIDQASTSFTALVTRLGCSDGRTGKVLPPVVDPRDDQVIVTFVVETLKAGRYGCASNDQVPYEVKLKQPLGNRSLVDGVCTPASGATKTVTCPGNGVRRQP